MFFYILKVPICTLGIYLTRLVTVQQQYGSNKKKLTYPFLSVVVGNCSSFQSYLFC